MVRWAQRPEIVWNGSDDRRPALLWVQAIHSIYTKYFGSSCKNIRIKSAIFTTFLPFFETALLYNVYITNAICGSHLPKGHFLPFYTEKFPDFAVLNPLVTACFDLRTYAANQTCREKTLHLRKAKQHGKIDITAFLLCLAGIIEMKKQGISVDQRCGRFRNPPFSITSFSNAGSTRLQYFRRTPVSALRRYRKLP